jgi:HemY protein
MLRWGLLIILIGALAVGAAWLAGHPGDVSLEWQDWQIDTSVAVLLIAAVLFAAIVAILYRLWWSLRRVPKVVGRMRQESRQRRGFEALSRGLVAAAAGDPEGAGKQARRAERLLDDPPLTMLLSAQAAQLRGDDQAAMRFFTTMKDRPATAFLGIRGLLTQAIKSENWPEALALAERAHRLNPKSDWVLSTLLDLQKRTGHWAAAGSTLDAVASRKLIAPAAVADERAKILVQQSESIEDSTEALSWARRAFKANPDHVPAAARYATLLIDTDKHRRAAAVIEKAWERSPDPELADLYWRACRCDEPLAKMKAAQALARRNPEHVESRIAIASAALDAHLWGEARKVLEPVAGEGASPRVCELMAELEEAEHGDLVRARTWLKRAADRQTSVHGAPLLPSPTGSVVAGPAGAGR